MARSTLKMIVAAGLLLVVAGCGAQSASGEPVAAKATVELGMPAEWERQIDESRLGEQILAGWVDQGETFAVVTWGSSTCLPVAETTQVLAPDELKVMLGPSPNEVCTMDLVPVTTTFELPEGLTERPIALTVELSEHGRSERLTLE